MRKIVWSAVIIGISILPFNLICYADGPGTTAASFLKIGVGARATAMGEAFTALADDGTAFYWNPAGLIQIKQRELSATYNLWFQGISQGYISFGFPSLGGTVGLGVNYVDMGDIEGRDEQGNPTGDFGASDVHLFAGYADKFKNISWGITVGWLKDTIDKDTKTTFLGNIGLLYPLTERFTLGVVAQNIGTKLGNDPLPFTFKVGAASKLETLTLAVDIAKPQDDEIYYCLGAEWWLRNLLALRVGYKTNQDIGIAITAGIGLKISKTSIDYAYVPYGDLGSTHRISLVIRF